MARLDANRIAAAALAILDEEGVAGFTIRAVANSLGVTPMALYHHVGDKAGLATLVVDLVNNETPLPLPTGAWQDDLKAVARWLRQTAAAHPAIAEVQRTYHIWTLSMVEVAERWTNLWQQSGLTPKRALLAASASSMAVSGLVAEERVYRDWHGPDATLLSRTPNAGLLFAAGTDSVELYDLAVSSIIDGLHARLLRGKGGRGTIMKTKTS